MKVIAKIHDGKFLIEATDKEIARIDGHYSRSDIAVGTEIEVNQVYEDVRTLLHSTICLETARQELIKLSGAIDRITKTTATAAKTIKAQLKSA